MARELEFGGCLFVVWKMSRVCEDSIFFTESFVGPKICLNSEFFGTEHLFENSLQCELLTISFSALIRQPPWTDYFTFNSLFPFKSLERYLSTSAVKCVNWRARTFSTSILRWWVVAASCSFHAFFIGITWAPWSPRTPCSIYYVKLKCFAHKITEKECPKNDPNVG